MKRFIKFEDREKPVYLSGKTRHGKSTLIQAMVYQDMRNSQGLCVIDGKGDMAHKILDWVPKFRKDHVIYLDLKTPIPIDFMTCENEDERDELISDIVQIFNRLDDGLGIRMDAIIRFTVESLDLIGDGTFLDIYHVIADPQFRQKIRTHPKVRANPYLALFWNEHAEKIIKGESGIAIAVSRMGRFVTSSAFPTILGTPNGLNIAEEIKRKSIIIVKLKPNSDAADLFGSLIISKIQQAIYRRDPEKTHPPFMLYVDEFHRFKTSGFDHILNTAGGLGLYITLSNQYFDQLSAEVRSAIVNSVSTFLLFRMGTKNAGELAGELKDPPAPPIDSHSIKQQIAKLRHNEDIMRRAEQKSRAHNVSQTVYTEMRMEDEAKRVALEKQLSQSTPISFLGELPYLRVGRALYRAADGTTTIIRTPAPPPHPSEVGKTSYAEYIRKRTVDKYPCNIPPVPHHESNDHQEKSEPIAGAAPSHERRKKRKP